MTKHSPSIFNDVTGPVMRGPSSSHSAAALRIGRMCRDLMQGDPGRVMVCFDAGDALATTHASQGSDMGMKGGLLGLEADDERLLALDEPLRQSGIEISFEVTETGYPQPNLYLVHLQNQKEELRVAAISTGGGMIELIEIDGTRVSMFGDCHELLIYTADPNLLDELKEQEQRIDRAIFFDGANPFMELKASQPPDPDWLAMISTHPSVKAIRSINAVMPVLCGKQRHLPFTNCEQMLLYNQKRKLSAWELAILYESIRGGLSDNEVVQRMGRLYKIMRTSVETGLRGTRYVDRIYGAQSVSYQQHLREGRLSSDDALHRVTLYVSAIMEVKSSMGVIVAAPTAGACATFPGAVLGVADSLGKEKEEIVRSLLTGSLVGLFIATGSTFSAEIGGCQAECGAAGGMAAAGIVHLMGGSLDQILSAASMALQNTLGMICDPIAARVEAPCLGKNISAAVNALSCANMALAGYDPLIPLDQVIETMDRVGKSLPRELRCTALGGLAITPAAKEIERKLRS